MKNLITTKAAVRALLILFSITIIFHVLVLTGFIPFTKVWGGRLQNQQEMLFFESVSLLLNLFMLGVVAVKGKYLKIQIRARVISVVLWCMFLIFMLNTVGNLMANNDFEKIAGTIGTLLLALLCLKLAISKD